MSVDLDNPPPECAAWARLLEAATVERNNLRTRLLAAIHEIERLTRERDEARAEWQGADGCVDAMVHERDAYRAMLRDLLASAHPHPVEHPAMAKQWARARELLKNGVPIRHAAGLGESK